VYSAADLCIVASLDENQPLVAQEALACGVPVVGFAVGGIPELVQPGVTGLLAPAEDVRALREAVARLLGDAALRAELSTNCRRLAEEQFDLTKQAQQFARLYEDLLAPGEPPPA
jgi:glycosyltransferase involved in cell wall biosynthesis